MDKALPSALSDFVDKAKYQQIVSDMLLHAKKIGATQAEVDLTASMGLCVTVRKSEVDTLEFNRDKAIGITVYVGNRKGSASTTDIQTNALEATVERAFYLAKLTEEDPFAGLASPNEMAKELRDLALYHPWEIGVLEAIHLATLCEQSAFAVDKRITNSDGATFNSAQGFHVYGNSHGFLGDYASSRHSLSCTAIAKEKGNMERDYQYTVVRAPEDLESPQKIGMEAGQKAVKRLGATRIQTQKVPVLFDASIASGLLSQFIAAISGGRLFRKTSFLLDSLDKSIFQNFVHIYERPHIPKGLASCVFDSDGVATKDKEIVQEGILKSYILSAYSARKLNLPNTGNAGGTHNLFIEPGKEDFMALVKKMHKGLIVTELMGQGVNLTTGDYSRGATGFWVEQGEIQYPVHEITIAGNLQNMFKQLVSVGNDIDKRHTIQTGSLLIEEMMIAGA